ncbi:hypothetical protein POJ06DRAFT_249259 [Lipomyces tetrasporus]|uniref:Uncharacterized protein n=1 Tax=Lipomyces tetrasporus TaxID=54092 RepID=A0AAD7QVJ0_9ASCO|nr:uncharacterized protein POJ06DRAFT_249259 [Lipomyces tetrasporus]KAJ8102282.1 hypothetical protein POJ06DRAFT_249259 [Lipomyces tetrasporus]
MQNTNSNMSSSSPSPPRSSPSSPSSKKSMPIPIPIPTGSKTALTQGAIISPTQIHRRASLPCWPPPNSPPQPGPSFRIDNRRATTTNAGVMQFSPSLYGCSPDQHSPAGFQRFQYPFAANFSLASAAGAGTAKPAQPRGFPPSPPSSAGPTSPNQSPTSSVAPGYVVCDHHHHRRQSIAVRFRPQDNTNDSAVDDSRPAANNETRPRDRRLSGGFARPPSPTGERILQGEVSF